MASARVKPGRRLIEQDQLGIADQRQPHVEPALPARVSRLSSRPTSAIVSSTDRGAGAARR
jgi:hypothetical protein